MSAANARLLEAAKRGDCAAALAELSGGGADVSCADGDGNTPAHWAARNGRSAVLQLLLEHGASVSAQNGHGSRPLHWAAHNGQLKCVRALLVKGADPAPRDADGTTPVWWALHNGNKACAFELAQRRYASVWAKSKRGAPQPQVCRSFATFPRWHMKLVFPRADKRCTPVQVKAARTACRAFFQAAVVGDETAALSVLDGSDVDAFKLHTTDVDGDGMLAAAALGGCSRLLSHLLESGASVSHRSRFGRTPLHWAAVGGSAGCMKELLVAACKGGEAAAAAAVSAADCDGDTPLHDAARVGSLAAAKVLLRHGAGARVANARGRTPLDLAREKEVCELLRCHVALEAVLSGGGIDADGAALLRKAAKDAAATANLENSDLVHANEWARATVAAAVALAEEKVRCASALVKAAEQHAAALAAGVIAAEKHLEHAAAEAAAAAAAALRGLTAAVLSEEGAAPPCVVGYQYLQRCTGDFAVERVIGAGAFGTVFRAVDVALGARFAVKRLMQAGSATREIAVLSRFRHPNIIRMLGYTADDEVHPRCVLYELAERGSLDAHLVDDSRAAQLTWRLRLHVASGLARALNFLHRGEAGAPAFHRDVKASNLVLMADWTPKLADCGLSKLFSDAELSAISPGASLAAASYGVAFGTLGYRCTAYSGGMAYSEKSEVFSMGVVLLELLTGQLSEVRPGNVGNLVGRYFEMGEPGALREARDARLQPPWDDGAATALEALAERCCDKYRLRPSLLDATRALAAAVREARAEGDGAAAAAEHARREAALVAAGKAAEDAAALAALAARRTCQCCTDDAVPLQAGLECRGTVDTAPHFLCFDCLSQYALSRAGPRLAAGLRCPGRLGGAAACDAPPYDDVALARGLSAEALRAVRDAHLRAQRLALEAGFAERERALLRRVAEEAARSGEVEELRLNVLESILTPKCPRCAHAFIGFAGCFALRCAPDSDAASSEWAAGFCGASFCAWCFEDCGDNAHPHVAACRYNRNRAKAANDRYFGTVDMFEAALHDMRVRRLRSYLARLQPQVLRPRLVAALRDDLADLGLDAERDDLLKRPQTDRGGARGDDAGAA